MASDDASTKRAHYERVQTLFTRVYELPPEDRASHLDAQPDGDTVHEVRDLLARSERAEQTNEDVIDRVVEDAAVKTLHEPAEAIPECVGEFKITRVIARGGMGVVYEAQQEAPQRRVALKLIRPGHATADMLRRFESEAQVLARLSHEGIARIFSVGTATTPLGRQPYIAMEYVDGAPIDVASAPMTLRQRVTLMERVCQAVHHAHQRGVIHRDIKPANVLVQDDATPKILDFGIARLDESKDATLTAVGQVLGTLAYASPEQLSGRPDTIDVRSDVYSLGVLLYEVLSRQLPVDIKDLPITEVMRRVNERDPVLLGKLDKTLRGDLETIAATALSKEPDERYSSAQAFAADLARFMNNEPIEARPPSALYVLRKFARRHRPLVAGATIAVAALITGMFLALQSARDATKARATAEAASAQANLTTASAQIRLGDSRRARRALDAVPPGQRDWPWHMLNARVDDSLETVSVNAVYAAPLPDGIRVLTGNPYSLTEVRNGTTTTRFAAKPGQGLQLDTSGRYLRVIRDGRSEIHDLEEDTTWKVPDLDGEPPSLHMSSFGDYLLCRTKKGCWVLPRGANQAKFIAARKGGFHNAIPTDDSFVGVSLRSVRQVAAWRPDGEALWAHDGGVDRPRLYALDPDSTRMAVGGYGGTWSVVDGVTGKIVTRGARHDATIHRIGFVPNSDMIATIDERGRLQLRDEDTGAFIEQLVGQSGCQLANGFAASATHIASTGLDGRTHLWDVSATRARRMRTLHESWGTGLQITPGHPIGFSSGYDGKLVLIDLKSFTPIATYHFDARTSGAVWIDERHFVVLSDGARHSYVRTVDAWTGKTLATRKFTQTYEFALAYSAKRDQIFVSMIRNILMALDPRTLETQHEHPATAPPLALSPNEDLIAHTTIGVVIDLETNESGPGCDLKSPLRALAFSPDSSLLVAGAADGTIEVYDVASNKRLARRSGHAGRTLAIAWHPSGKYFVSGGDDGVLVVWDGTTYEHIVDLPAHKAYVRSLAFNASGNSIYTSCGDGTVGHWSTESTRERSGYGAALLQARANARTWLAKRTGSAEELIQAAKDDPTLTDATRYAVLLRHLARAAATQGK